MNNIKISTSRVFLRKFVLTDLFDLNYYSKIEEISYLGGFNLHRSLFDTSVQLKEFMFSKEVYAIALKPSSKVIGSISFRKPEKFLNAESNSIVLGFVLSPDYWRQGIMSELLISVHEFLFENGIEKIYLGHFHYNLASKALINKMNYKYLNTMPVFIYSQKKNIDVLYYYLEKQVI